MGPSQDDAVSGVLLGIYFEKSLRMVSSFKQAMNKNSDDEDNGNMPLSYVPQETIYPDDADF